MVFFYKGIEVLQVKEEIDSAIDEMKAAGCKSVLEIGSYKGGLTAYLRDQGFKVLSVDINGVSDIKGDSTDPQVIDRVKREFSYYAVFIDGDHQWDFPFKDYINYAAGNNGCRMALFDDIKWPNVRKYYDIACGIHRHIEIISENNNTEWNGIGIIYL